MLFALTCLAAQCQQPWPLWDAYRQHFLDNQGRIIDRSAHDPNAADRTTSEGQAYALFFALTANDREHFDQLLHWTEANLAQGDLTAHLPAWSWGRNPAGEWKTIDDHSAADADLWLAYTLIEAGRLWHDTRLDALGRTIAARIATEEVALVPGLGPTLLPGAKGFAPDPDHFILNPSYLPLPILTGLAHTLPKGPWAAMLKCLPKLLVQPATHGFAMDWVLAGKEGVHPAPPPAAPSAGEREGEAAGSYDAIRVYLWLGISDPATPGRRILLAQLNGMAAALKTSLTPPLAIDAQGKVLRADGPVGFSAALIPYLQALGARSAAAAQADRLVALRDPATHLYGRQMEYYDQNLVLFSTGWTEQKYRFDATGRLRVNWK